jgi:transcriptional regulator with XRE-family HTH domain
MARRKNNTRESSAQLGRNIQKMRIAKDMSRKQLGKIVNKPEQQIALYESGDFVSLPMIEAIGEALGEPVEKKIIRRISFVRKLEVEQNTQMEEELTELYNAAFPEVEEDEEYE